MGVGESSSCRRWLLHTSVHHDGNAVVHICPKLLDRLNVAGELLRAASDPHSHAHRLAIAAVRLLNLLLLDKITPRL